jgi:hypothetical protein
MGAAVTTWQVFATEVEASDYCALTWAAIVREAPLARIPAEFHAFVEALRSIVFDARSPVDDVIRAVSVVPVYGVDHTGEIVTDAGESRSWARPEPTAAGAFAVPCLEGFDVGGPAPAWPNDPGLPPPPPV